MSGTEAQTLAERILDALCVLSAQHTPGQVLDALADASAAAVASMAVPGHEAFVLREYMRRIENAAAALAVAPHLQAEGRA